MPTLPAKVPDYTEVDPATGLHMTGTPKVIDLATYRLKVDGKVTHELSLSYDDLRRLPKVTATPTLVCQGFFTDITTWSGVPFKTILEMAGVQTDIASARRGIIRGMLGNMVEATVALNRVNADDYDAIVFVGGPGVEEYFDDPVAKNIARDAAGKRKVVAAISAAPTILANAGILMGRRATAFLSERDKLQQAGAIFITSTPVERDRFIITCSGPAAAVQFGRAIAQALAGG